MASDDLIRLMHTLFLPIAGTFQESRWRPATDIHRLPDGWLVKFELAGVRPEEIELFALGNVLTVRGVRRDCCPPGPHQCYQMEIDYSHFERSLSLPVNLDHADITTEYQFGMLLVHIKTEAES